ncbi:hypothetical protein AB0L97_36810 [Nocardia sp. NPDC051911]
MSVQCYYGVRRGSAAFGDEIDKRRGEYPRLWRRLMEYGAQFVAE